MFDNTWCPASKCTHELFKAASSTLSCIVLCKIRCSQTSSVGDYRENLSTHLVNIAEITYILGVVYAVCMCICCHITWDTTASCNHFASIVSAVLQGLLSIVTVCCWVKSTSKMYCNKCLIVNILWSFSILRVTIGLPYSLGYDAHFSPRKSAHCGRTLYIRKTFVALLGKHRSPVKTSDALIEGNRRSFSSFTLFNLHLLS